MLASALARDTNCAITSAVQFRIIGLAPLISRASPLPHPIIIKTRCINVGREQHASEPTTFTNTSHLRPRERVRREGGGREMGRRNGIRGLASVITRLFLLGKTDDDALAPAAPRLKPQRLTFCFLSPSSSFSQIRPSSARRGKAISPSSDVGPFDRPLAFLK